MKKRILLVDDEEVIIKTVGTRLEMEGYEVLVAVDGDEALEKANAERPDLIILDLMLPKKNGHQVCALLKRESSARKIPVVICTARASQKDEQASYECGADAYIRKPFQTRELLDTIRRLIARPAAFPPG